VARRDHLAQAYALGVRLFVVDSSGEVAKLADVAPGAAVLVRIVTSGSGSDWPLSRKYGCTVDEAVALLVAAGRHGLDPAGVSFHVGSQQRDPQAWGAPVASAAKVFAAVRAAGFHPWLLDLGGGFPARLDGEPLPIVDYGRSIDAHLQAALAQHCDRYAPMCYQKRLVSPRRARPLRAPGQRTGILWPPGDAGCSYPAPGPGRRHRLGSR